MGLSIRQKLPITYFQCMGVHYLMLDIDGCPLLASAFALPPSHRRKLRTTNLVGRLNQEIGRRTRVARLFPNEAACLRLVSAVLMEISEDWQTAERRYVVFNEERAIEG